MKERAIFLDRDGVINKQPAEHDYVKNWEEFIWLPTSKEAIKLINQKGFLAIVISNQRGVARGLMTVKDVDDVNEKMQKDLAKIGAKLDAVYWCGHDYSDNCDCRKPAPGLILQAAKDFNIDLSNSWVVGDSNDDIQAGKAVGCKTLKIKTNGSLLDAVKKILKN